MHYFQCKERRGSSKAYHKDVWNGFIRNLEEGGRYSENRKQAGTGACGTAGHMLPGGEEKIKVRNRYHILFPQNVYQIELRIRWTSETDIKGRRTYGGDVHPPLRFLILLTSLFEKDTKNFFCKCYQNYLRHLWLEILFFRFFFYFSIIMHTICFQLY